MATFSVRPTKESLSYKCLGNSEHFVEEKAQTVTVTHSLKTQLAEVLHLGFFCTPGNTLHLGLLADPSFLFWLDTSTFKAVRHLMFHDVFPPNTHISILT